MEEKEFLATVSHSRGRGNDYEVFTACMLNLV